MRKFLGPGSSLRRILNEETADFCRKGNVETLLTILRQGPGITGRISRLGILFPVREANMTGTTRQKLPTAAV